MSKKRTADESNNDEETNEETPVQRDSNAKRRKLNLLSDTTIEDLPFELLELILVKVVVIEVKDLDLAKSVWKEKADLSIDQLRTVCPQWSNVLTTKSFRTKLHRSLDNTAQTIRLKVLHGFSFPWSIYSVTTLKNDIFTHHAATIGGASSINVCNRNDVGTVKDVISLPPSYVHDMTGCNVSNCVYVSVGNCTDASLSLFRISRDVDEQFKVTPWATEYERPINMMHIAINGSLLFLSKKEGDEPPVVSICTADGSLQHEVTLPLNGFAFTIRDLLLKSNGNLVVAYNCEPDFEAQLLEIDTTGSAIRQFKSSSYAEEDCSVCVDSNDRIVVPIHTDDVNGFELLDSEFNLLARYMYSHPQDKNTIIFPINFHYDNEKNEISQIYDEQMANFLTIFRLTVA